MTRLQHSSPHNPDGYALDQPPSPVKRMIVGKLATIHDSDDGSLQDLSQCVIDEAHGLHLKPQEQCSGTGSTAFTLGTSASSSSCWFDENDVPRVIKTVRFSIEPPQVEYSSHCMTSPSSDALQREEIWYASHQVHEMENSAHEDLVHAMARCPGLSPELWDLFQACQNLDIYDTDDQLRLVQLYYKFLTIDEIRGMERYIHPNMRKHRHYHTKSILQLQHQVVRAKVAVSPSTLGNLLRCKSLETSRTSSVLALVLGLADDQSCADGQEDQSSAHC